jgi:hypothetical protein
MSTDSNPPHPLLGKMDALIKKHRGPAEAQSVPTAPEGWLPVLTEVVTRGTPSNTPLTANPPSTLPTLTPETLPAPALTDTDKLAEQLLDELGPKLSAVMEKQVATEFRKNLDETVATLLSQLDVNVRDIVRDAVAEKLKSRKPDS